MYGLWDQVIPIPPSSETHALSPCAEPKIPKCESLGGIIPNPLQLARLRELIFVNKIGGIFNPQVSHPLLFTITFLKKSFLFLICVYVQAL